MPRTEEAYQQIRTERREQILQAAAQVFARKGLATATITDIAAQAGVSHGLLYRHFASKEEVFAAVIDQSLANAERLAQSALAQPGTPWERICWITERIFPGTSLGNRPGYFMVVLHALTNEDVPEHIRAQAAKQGNVIYNVIRQFISDGQEAGQVIVGDPDQLARCYLACIQGLVIGSQFNVRSQANLPPMEMVLRILHAEE